MYEDLTTAELLDYIGETITVLDEAVIEYLMREDHDLELLKLKLKGWAPKDLGPWIVAARERGVPNRTVAAILDKPKSTVSDMYQRSRPSDARTTQTNRTPEIPPGEQPSEEVEWHGSMDAHSESYLDEQVVIDYLESDIRWCRQEMELYESAFLELNDGPHERLEIVKRKLVSTLKSLIELLEK